MRRNWLLVGLANYAGAALAALVIVSGHTELNAGPIGQPAIKIAPAKQSLTWKRALFRAVLCNVLACITIMAGRSAADWALAIVLPVTALWRLVLGTPVPTGISCRW